MLPRPVLRLTLAAALLVSVRAVERPNLLWITAEDMSPNLACYGDSNARAPHLDAFAREAVRYTRAFATAPVCSPARSTLITGIYATSLGNPHLRCEMPLPPFVRGYAAWLRDAGYFTTNNVKTDYNQIREAEFVRDAWNESSERAHWRTRAAGQPFLAVFNLMETHQSRTSVWPEEQFEREIGSRLAAAGRADPARLQLPPFYPDTPAARKAMARYFDCIAAADRRVGEILRELETDGLADDTIVFFYSDHGMGMPGGKRLLRDSGLHVPLLIRFPRKWRHLAPAAPGESTDRLVSFVDFAPTVLSLAGVPLPAYLQGGAFLGAAAGPERTQVFGARDRVDEAFDTARSVRDARWLYIRNYRPELSWAQPERYSDASAFRRELLAGVRAGRLGQGPTAWLAPQRAPEELYDTAADPGQLRNVAGDPAHAATLERMRGALRRWLLDVRDAAFLTEEEALARAGTRSLYAMARDPQTYPLEAILAAAERVGRHGAVDLAAIRQDLQHPDAAVRRWAVIARRAPGSDPAAARADFLRALEDRSAAVRIEAAGALLAAGDDDRALAALAAALRAADANVVLQASRTLERAGPRARPLREAVQARHARAMELGANAHLEFFIGFALGAWLDAWANPPAGPTPSSPVQPRSP